MFGGLPLKNLIIEWFDDLLNQLQIVERSSLGNIVNGQTENVMLDKEWSSQRLKKKIKRNQYDNTNEMNGINLIIIQTFNKKTWLYPWGGSSSHWEKTKHISEICLHVIISTEWIERDIFSEVRLILCKILDLTLTWSLPKTLIKTPPSKVGCESTEVMTLFIFWKAND